MTHAPSQCIIRSRPAFQRGQSIVVALLVLLLLAFLGSLFASIVTRNLRSAARSGQVQNADFYAQAGLRFADDQLTHSTDGADWRPPLQFQLASAFLPTDTRALARYNAIKSTLLSVPPQHPDRAFLEQGFTPYTIGQGRFLLRLTYTPVPGSGADPRGRYIKIESVGRDGVVDATDPTTYGNAPPTRLNAALTEYKAIGITDYARFETNPDKRSDIMALGVASQMYNNGTEIVTPGVYDFDSQSTAANVPLRPYPVVTTYGAPYAYVGGLTPNPNDPFTAPASGGGVAGGGSIHANGTVRFYGVNTFYLNNTPVNTGTLGETLEVGGDLLLDSYDPAQTLNGAQNSAVLVYSVAPPVPTVTPGPLSMISPPPTTAYVGPSNDAARPFDTHTGLVRDAGTQTDINGLPRNVNRLEPPTLDSTDPVSNLTRYKALTQKSPARAVTTYSVGAAVVGTVAGAGATSITDPNAGADGYGRSIYVNNPNDTQPESSKVLGGFTLVDEWLHRAEPGSAVGGGRDPWTANFYRPPGVEIVLGRQRVSAPTSTNPSNTTTFYGVRLVRSDVDGAGQPVFWNSADGTRTNVDGTPAANGTMIASYDDLLASNDPAVVPTSGAALTAYQANPNNDVVIYAEGNVRVRGAASAGTGDTLNPTSADTVTPGDDALPRHITIVTNGTAYIDGPLVRGNPDSSITVLAHDYVCVNTTQFLAGAQVDEDLQGTQPPGAYTGDTSLRALDFSLSDQVLLQEFNDVINSVAGSPNPALYVSGGPGASGTTQADFDILDAQTGFQINSATIQPFQTPVAAPLYSSTGAVTSTFSHTTYPLNTVSFGMADSQFYQLAVRRTPAPVDATATQDFLLERAAILPMDVKIEATLFAQTRSFFVIPGEWFNTASDDNMGAFVTNRTNGLALRDQRSGTDASQQDAARFPFYGQPPDLKITVYGSVSEARPADIAAQTAWMLKWGWIPQYHGSTFAPSVGTETAGHKAPLDSSGTNPLPQPAVGLALVYNPLAAYPYSTGATAATSYYLRTDQYGRPLPYAPKLPVCAGLLYAGQSFDQPILQ